MKTILLLISFLFFACAPAPMGILVISRTQPLVVEGDSTGEVCTVRVELEGHIYTFASYAGCNVLRREISVPEYDIPAPMSWQPPKLAPMPR